MGGNSMETSLARPTPVSLSPQDYKASEQGKKGVKAPREVASTHYREERDQSDFSENELSGTPKPY